MDCQHSGARQIQLIVCLNLTRTQVLHIVLDRGFLPGKGTGFFFGGDDFDKNGILRTSNAKNSTIVFKEMQPLLIH